MRSLQWILGNELALHEGIGPPEVVVYEGGPVVEYAHIGLRPSCMHIEARSERRVDDVADNTRREKDRRVGANVSQRARDVFNHGGTEECHLVSSR